jgi:hypothetical protein
MPVIWNYALSPVSSLRLETSDKLHFADVYCNALSSQTSRLGGNTELLFNRLKPNFRVHQQV